MLGTERIDMEGGETLLQSLLEIPVMYTTNFNSHYIAGGVARKIFRLYFSMENIATTVGVVYSVDIKFDKHLVWQIGKGIPKILTQSPPNNTFDGD